MPLLARPTGSGQRFAENHRLIVPPRTRLIAELRENSPKGRTRFPVGKLDAVKTGKIVRVRDAIAILRPERILPARHLSSGFMGKLTPHARLPSGLDDEEQ